MKERGVGGGGVRRGIGWKGGVVFEKRRGGCRRGYIYIHVRGLKGGARMEGLKEKL